MWVTVFVALSISVSLARTSKVTGVSSLVVTASGLATGASLTGVSDTSTVAVVAPPSPSVTV